MTLLMAYMAVLLLLIRSNKNHSMAFLSDLAGFRPAKLATPKVPNKESKGAHAMLMRLTLIPMFCPCGINQTWDSQSDGLNYSNAAIMYTNRSLQQAHLMKVECPKKALKPTYLL